MTITFAEPNRLLVMAWNLRHFLTGSEQSSYPDLLGPQPYPKWHLLRRIFQQVTAGHHGPVLWLGQEARHIDVRGNWLANLAERELAEWQMRVYPVVDPSQGPLDQLQAASWPALRPHRCHPPADGVSNPLRGLHQFELVGCRPATDLLNTVSVHLTYHDDAARHSQVKYWTNLAAPDKLAIVGGDWNSVPADLPGHPSEVEPAPDDIPRHLHSHHFLLEPTPDGTRTDRSVDAEMLRAGFGDVARQVRDTTTTVNPGQGVNRRCDRIYLSPRLAAAVVPDTYRVHIGPAVEEASDHRPVSVVVDLSEIQ